MCYDRWKSDIKVFQQIISQCQAHFFSKISPFKDFQLSQYVIAWNNQKHRNFRPGNIINLISMGSKHSKIGLVELKDPYNPESTMQLAHKQEVRQMFKKEHWYLDKGKFSSLKLQSIFPSIKQAKITILNLAANNIQELPSTLSGINFPNLQRLKLCGNSIVSIDSLIFLQADQLIELSLSWNNIVSVRPLRKCKFRKLKYLSLEENSINNLAEDLALCEFPVLREVSVQPGVKSGLVCDTLETWCAKWQSNFLYELACSSSRRIKRPIAAQQLKEKYCHLRILRDGQRKEKHLA